MKNKKEKISQNVGSNFTGTTMCLRNLIIDTLVRVITESEVRLPQFDYAPAVPLPDGLKFNDVVFKFVMIHENRIRVVDNNGDIYGTDEIPMVELARVADCCVFYEKAMSEEVEEDDVEIKWENEEKEEDVEPTIIRLNSQE